MRPEVQTSLDSDLVLNRLFRFCYLTLVLWHLFEVTGLIDLTVSFVQPQTPGGVDAYSYRLPTASKGCGGWENF